MRVPDTTALRDWAASGAMALTGRRSGPPLVPCGSAASHVRHALARVAQDTEKRTGTAPPLPGVELLGERAAILGLERNGPWSCGGSFRLWPTQDGWFGLSLPRPDDLDLVPALVMDDVADPWSAVATWARCRTTNEAVERARLLGLPCAGLPAAIETTRAPVELTYGPRRTTIRERPRVVDLTALWAGPLCAHLLGLAGAEVTKVESTRRLDGARSGPPAFFDLLHEGHRMVALDLTDPAGVASLRALIADADLVLEASRPRAMSQLGILASEAVESGTSWLSITARGRSSNAVGFGDDVAAGAGLVVADGSDLLPCGDAMADPLSGVTAAAVASGLLLEERAVLADLSMHHVVCDSVQGPEHEPHAVVRRGDEWWVDTESGEFLVAPPQARRPVGRAGAPGADGSGMIR